MPRSSQSPESKVLEYFKTAPLAAVQVVIGLVKEIVKGREEAPVAKVGGKRRKRAKAVHAPVPAVAAAHETTKIKKSHKAKPKVAGKVGDGAELDDLEG